MSFGWERAIARVLVEGRPDGAAFLIAGGYLLTCTHVVASVLGLDSDTVPAPGSVVTVDFPLMARLGPLAARVCFSTPIGADLRGDLAVLKLVGQAPADVAPLRLSAAENIAGHRWRAFGFPSGRRGAKDAGVWSTGTVEGREGTGWLQLRTDRDAPFPLAQGFSGGPIWDEEFAAVIGIVVTVEADPSLRTGYALTVEAVERDWPALRSALVAGNPYRGLSAFTEGDASVFFGRDLETARLLDLVDGQSAAIVPVLGASGVGKSSLVNAGLVSKLLTSGRYITARIPHGRDYTAHELIAWALITAARDRSGDADAWRKHWRELSDRLQEPGELELAVDLTLGSRPVGTRLLLVVDQFESLLAEAPETAAGLDALLASLTARRLDGSRAVQAVVITRIDFLRHLDEAPHIAAAWEQTQIVVPPLTREQLRAVAALPLAGLGGTRFADGVLERIIGDTPPGAGGLPLLEFTLAELWREQQRGELTAAAYHALGGVGGALAGIAERILYQWADKTEESALERIFIQLVRPGEVVDAGERAPDTRRVADRDQFTADEWALIQRLSTSRLVMATRQPAGNYTVELTHEVLIRAWPRLAAWIEDNREFRSWQEQVRSALRAWESSARDPARVLSTTQVDTALGWIQKRSGEIRETEREFIRTSRLAAARKRRRQRGAIAAIVTASLLGSVAAAIAVEQHDNGVQQQQTAQSSQLASRSSALAATDPDTAKQLAIAAYHTAPTAEAFNALSGSLALPGTIAAPAVTSATVSNTLIAITAGGKMQLWSRHDHAIAATLPTRGVTAAAFSADGAHLAIGTFTGGLEIWDVTHSKHPARTRVLTGATGYVLAVAFSSDGRLIASGGTDRVIRLWSPTTGDTAPLAVVSAGTNAVADLAFGPDGRELAEADRDGYTSLWDVSRPTLPVAQARIEGAGSMRSVAFSPDGRMLAATGTDDEVHLWDLTDRQSPKPRAALSLTAAGSAVAFSPDGGFILAATVDHGARISMWNLGALDSPAPLTLPDGLGNTDLAVSPDGELVTLAQTAADTRRPDDQIRIWRAVNLDHPAASALPSPNDAESIAMSADGKILVEAGFDGVSMWNVQASSHPRRLWSMPDPAHDGENVALSGHTLAIGSKRTIALWNVADPSRPVRQGSLSLAGAGGGSDSLEVAFSPRGDLLVARDSYVNKAWIIETATATRPSASAIFTSVPRGEMTFSADGSTLAIAYAPGESPSGGPAGAGADTWDIRDPTHPVSVPAVIGGIGAVTAIDFSRSSAVLAAGASDGTITLWQAPAISRSQRITSLAGAGSAILTVRFSADGRFLADIDVDAKLRMWDVSTPDKPVLIGQYTVVALDDTNTLAGETATVVVSPALTPDGGRQIYTDVPIGAGEIWTSSAGALVQQLCQAVGDTLTSAQLAQYTPNSGLSSPCRETG